MRNLHLIKSPYARWVIYSLTLLLAYPHIERMLWASDQFNGLPVNDPLVPIDEIRQGGPPLDGIPSLDFPKFINASEVERLKGKDRVLGLHYNGIAKAYPIRILDYHEIVNDEFNKQPVLVSYCPLCGTGIAFDAHLDGRYLNFGVSGLLYNSDVLMFDRQTGSLWSQIMQQAISGPLKGSKLTMLALEHTKWTDWLQRYPDTKVLSFDTGHSRRYGRTPYVGYSKSEELYFPVMHKDKRFHPKEIILGVEVNGVFKAYAFRELSGVNSPLNDSVNGKPFSIHFDAKGRTGRVLDKNGEPYPSLTAFWFAWVAFHPETDVYQEDE